MLSKLPTAIKRIQLFLLFAMIVISSVFTGCSNDDLPPVPYTGILIDGATGNPVPNHKIYLLRGHVHVVDWLLFERYERDLVMPNTPSFAIDSTITAANGIFTFPGQDLPVRDAVNFPGLGNRDNIFCYKRIFRQTVSGIDSFFTEPTRWLKVTMQKNGMVHPTDTVMENISLYNTANPTQSRTHFKAQVGITNHIIEIPYSQNFANKVFIEWRYRGDMPPATGVDSTLLNGNSDTEKIINY